MRGSSLRRGAAAFLLVVCAVASARADLIQMKDGRTIDGVPMKLEADAIVLEYKSGKVRVPLAMVADYAISGAAPFEPKTDEEKAKRAEGLVPYNGKWVKVEERDKALKAIAAKRQAELDEVRAHQEWRSRYKFASANFTFESTLPPRLNDEYASLMETYFTEFKKSWGVKVPKEWGKLKVCFYHDRKTFNQVSGGRGGVLAYYRFVPPRELNFFYDPKSPRGTLDCMFHEANHYLTDLVDEQFQYPHWVNEAMAEYYGSAEWDPKTKKMQVGRIQEGRLAELKADIEAGKKLSLSDLIGKGDGAYEHYYWGWSFVHFMMSTPAYEKKFKDFFVELAKSKEVRRDVGGFNFTEVSGDECLRFFMKRFGLKDTDGLQAEWYAYIEKLNLEGAGVRGLEEAGIAAYRRGATRFRAPRQLKAAIDGGSKNAEVYILYSKCLRFKGGDDNLAASLDVLEKALANDPLDADVVAEKAYVLNAMGRSDEAQQMIALAREMNPENPYLEMDIVEALSGND